jgi:uncharacterized protein YukE
VVCTINASVIPVSDETVVETGGVTVSKFFNADDFPVPAVAFEVTSSREQPVTLRIVDEVPDEFGIDQIGFHPEYGSEHWDATGNGVVRFEREVDPGESFTTVYGVRMDEGQDETPFLSAPNVEVEGEDEDIDEVVPPESTSVVRELAGGERETVPGLEDDAEIEAEVEAGGGDGLESLEDDAEILGGGEDETEADPAADAAVEAESDFEPETDLEAELESESEPEPEPQTVVAGGGDSEETPGSEPGIGTDPEEPAAASEPTDVEAGMSGEPGTVSEETEPPTETNETFESGAPEVDDEPVEVEQSEPASVGFDAGDVVGALAEAIREDEVPEEDLETLQSAFGGVPNSTQVEIEHLQSRLSELEAYTDALEEFIDEEGTAHELVAGIESDVAALNEELEDVEASVEHAAEDREDIRDRIEDVEAGFDAVDELEADLERLRGDLEALDERVADTEELAFEVDDLEDDLEDLEEHVDEIEEWRGQLSDVFGT